MGQICGKKVAADVSDTRDVDGTNVGGDFRGRDSGVNFGGDSSNMTRLAAPAEAPIVVHGYFGSAAWLIILLHAQTWKDFGRMIPFEHLSRSTYSPCVLVLRMHPDGHRAGPGWPGRPRYPRGNFSDTATSTGTAGHGSFRRQ
jgi:hypothetical protein